MTALAGYCGFGASRDARDACARMLRAQAVYGQEDASWSDGRIALGRRLYRRLPEDRFDRGPAVTEDGRITLVGDVRLDNREELADALDLASAEAARLSDSALLLRGYLRWETAVLDRLAGDFAFAVWHPARQRLLLARDFAGNRPLHYHRGDGFFAFASMPKGLHALPEIPYRLDEDRVGDFLGLFHSAGEGSFFAGIERVRPGHVVTVTPDSVHGRRYWQPDVSPLRLKDGADYVAAMREKLDRAVAARLRGAGAAVASHLSAGLDSSGVTATAARLMQQQGGRVAAFTAAPAPGSRLLVPAGRLADEGALAAETASLYPNVDHVRVETGGRSPLDSLDRNFLLYDRPRLNLCNAVWIDAIKDEAKKRGLAVMLTAQFGNLSLSYSGEHRLPELLESGRLLRLGREIAALRRRGTGTRTIAAATIGPFVPRGLWAALARRRGRGGPGWFGAISPAAAQDPDFVRRAEAAGRDFDYRPVRTAAQWMLGALPHFDSGIENKATLGGWGIDVRDPTSDRGLVEFCLRVPAEQYLKDGVMRSLARRALADRVPEAVASSTRRGYQSSDWVEGLEAAREAIGREIERSAPLPATAATLDLDRLQRLQDQWPESWTDPKLIHRYRFQLLRAVSAGHFIRRVTGGNG
ncbi:MAG TPA: asparagine synthase-related protein [Allosphingosinicella sp.]|nr:asparagine synthase-related protein [Allosphingosinicella sp.]